jgi:inner membrane protein
MPTVITHPAAALGLLPWFRREVGRPAVLAVGVLLTMLPDLDVVGFALGIPYGHLLGHRGLSHSLFFALVVGGLVALPVARAYRLRPAVLWLYFFLCLASHGLLDALTSGGLGIAFFSPFSNERYFFDFRPLRVSAIGLSDFLASRWTAVLASELKWVWLPALALGAAGAVAARLTRRVAGRPPGTAPEGIGDGQ